MANPFSAKDLLPPEVSQPPISLSNIPYANEASLRSLTGNLASTATQQATNLASSTMSTLSSNLGAVDGAAQNAVATASRLTSQAQSQLTNITSNFQSTIASSVSNVSDSVSNAISGGVSNFGQKLTSTVDSVTGGLGKGLSGIGNLGKSKGGGTQPGGGEYSSDEEQGKFGFKVRLFAVRNFPSDYVVFEASPTLNEARSVEYAAVTPVHMPGSIQIYKRTNSRTWSISAKFVSRNQQQATANMMYLQKLRGWTMPYFGLRSNVDGFTQPYGSTDPVEDSSSMLGAPPDVLYFYAYSDHRNASKDRELGLVNLKKIPVVMTSLNIAYPEDVDYIPVVGTGEPFPVKMDVTLELAETHAPKGYEQFSLSMFKRGQLVQF